ncbi:SDR family NAD(P)-dependent oxidoreductase [Sinimarinibacterium flocculans]|uniref:SDR family NAD(P)-dependent oxidoreductase n=1 Tax=Sinimarinibacterium flocculans TaxID=985250 RepID=UPI0024902F22|nr:SDR family NAD(P)-dependent oxidoreductase [Sinimarinibacterium flocculans]
MSAAIRGRTIVITGASGGIGEAAALRLGRAGARLCLVARRADELTRVQNLVRALGGEAWIYPTDLSQPGEVEACADALLAEHARIDVLVNNAGRSIRRRVTDSFERMHDYERTMALNYFAAVRLTLRLLPGMVERDDGHVVNVSSLSALMPTPRFSAYVASKCALEGFSRTLAAEMSGRNVAVSVINFPLVKTAMSAPTAVYRYLPQMSTDKAAGWIVKAIETRRYRIVNRFGEAWNAATALAPDPTVKWTGHLFRVVGARLQRRADRDAAPEHEA